MKKVIIAQLSIKEKHIDAFLNLSGIMVKASNNEKGCLAYKLLKEQNQHHEFFIYEVYENEKAIEEHKASQHFKKFLHSVLPLLKKEPLIEVF